MGSCRLAANVPREQLLNALDRMIRDTDTRSQITFGIDSVQLGRTEQTIIAAALSPRHRSPQKESSFAQSHDPQRSFCSIIIDFDVAVITEVQQCFPPSECDRMARAYRIFSRVSLMSPRAIVSAIPATACCACCEPHAARLAGVLGFLSRWHTTPRCVPALQLQREICGRPRDRKTFSVRAPSTLLPECGLPRKSDQSPRNHPLQCAGKVPQVRLRMFALAIR